MRPTRPKAGPAGPSQRQLRAGELIRHALAEVYREGTPQDPILAEVIITFTEVRMSPDLRHATCFVETLGGVRADQAVIALNHHARYLRGRLGRHIELKFTPALKFRHDESFAEAERMSRLFENPKVRKDLDPDDEAAEGSGDGT